MAIFSTSTVASLIMEPYSTGQNKPIGAIDRCLLKSKGAYTPAKHPASDYM